MSISLEEKVTLRSEVQEFAQMMEKKLRAKDYKGGWQDESIEDWLFPALWEEVLELALAIRENKSEVLIAEEAVDVANFAMMIADVTQAQAKEVDGE